MRTAMAAVVPLTIVIWPMWTALRRIHSACSACWAMPGSGRRTAGMTAMWERHPPARHGLRAIAANMRSAAAHGTICRCSCAPLHAVEAKAMAANMTIPASLVFALPVIFLENLPQRVLRAEGQDHVEGGGGRADRKCDGRRENHCVAG